MSSSSSSMSSPLSTAVPKFQGSAAGPIFDKVTFYVPNIIFFVLSVVFVVLRLYSRRLQRLRLDASDYCTIIALVFSVLVSVAAYVGVANGAGERALYLLRIDPAGGKIVLLLKDLMLATIPYLMSLAFSRISILLLYRSIFQTPFMRISSVVLAVVVSLIAISAMLITVFSCQPVDGFWLVHNMDPPPKCLNTPALYLGVGLLTVVMDVACLLLPIRDIVQLRLNTRDKIIVLALFFMGGLTIVVSIPRLIVVAQGDDNDVSYWLASIALWSSIETSVAIICVCLPVLRPVVRRVGASLGWGRDVRELSARGAGYTGSHDQRSIEDDADRERSLHHPGQLSPQQLDAMFPEIDIELEKARGKVAARWHYIDDDDHEISKIEKNRTMRRGKQQQQQQQQRKQRQQQQQAQELAKIMPAAVPDFVTIGPVPTIPKKALAPRPTNRHYHNSSAGSVGMRPEGSAAKFTGGSSFDEDGSGSGRRSRLHDDRRSTRNPSRWESSRAYAAQQARATITTTATGGDSTSDDPPRRTSLLGRGMSMLSRTASQQRQSWRRSGDRSGFF